jgi:hypothetical protein
LNQRELWPSSDTSRHGSCKYFILFFRRISPYCVQSWVCSSLPLQIISREASTHTDFNSRFVSFLLWQVINMALSIIQRNLALRKLINSSTKIKLPTNIFSFNMGFVWYHVFIAEIVMHSNNGYIVFVSYHFRL